MIIHETKIKVRYAETDQMGVVHHSIYLTYLEIGRTELIRSMGITYREMEEKGVMLPVFEICCKYLGPAKYDDELIIKTVMTKKPGIKIVFNYEIFNQNKIICTASSVLAFISAETKRPTQPPDWFIKLFENIS